MAEPKRLLLLGGTGEAAELAERLAADPRISLITSLAGRTRSPARLPGKVRSGGFGGAEGLAVYLKAEGIDLVVDATHPFAAEISGNAAAACTATGLPRLLLARPPWRKRGGDSWIPVAEAEAAAAALRGLARRVFLTVGSQELAAFARLQAIWFLVRLIDAPDKKLSLADYRLILGRGPFAEAEEAALLAKWRIEALVTKNSGGEATYGKIAAARRLGLPVVMIERPASPPGETVESVAAALAWVEAALS